MGIANLHELRTVPGRRTDDLQGPGCEPARAVERTIVGYSRLSGTSRRGPREVSAGKSGLAAAGQQIAQLRAVLRIARVLPSLIDHSPSLRAVQEAPDLAEDRGHRGSLGVGVARLADGSRVLRWDRSERTTPRRRHSQIFNSVSASSPGLCHAQQWASRPRRPRGDGGSGLPASSPARSPPATVAGRRMEPDQKEHPHRFSMLPTSDGPGVDLARHSLPWCELGGVVPLSVLVTVVGPVGPCGGQPSTRPGDGLMEFCPRRAVW